MNDGRLRAELAHTDRGYVGELRSAAGDLVPLRVWWDGTETRAVIGKHAGSLTKAADGKSLRGMLNCLGAWDVELKVWRHGDSVFAIARRIVPQYARIEGFDSEDGEAGADWYGPGGHRRAG